MFLGPFVCEPPAFLRLKVTFNYHYSWTAFDEDTEILKKRIGHDYCIVIAPPWSLMQMEKIREKSSKEIVLILALKI